MQMAKQQGREGGGRGAAADTRTGEKGPSQRFWTQPHFLKKGHTLAEMFRKSSSEKKWSSRRCFPESPAYLRLL